MMAQQTYWYGYSLVLLWFTMLFPVTGFVQASSPAAPADTLLDGRWLYNDITNEAIQYDNDPNAEHRTRVNEPLDSIVIESRTLLKIGADGKRYKFGYIKFVDSTQAEYARRCCWEGEEKRKYQIDSMAAGYLKLVRIDEEYHPGYDPQQDFDSPLPRGEKQPGFTIIEKRVVIFRRLTSP